ncbi:ARM repeat-containing protein [Rhizoclosmatium globosum]|uniref:ARM repeat-containing protein n=1 Tax=Rhizoclosmatium globosum TaxID=329046 RepID=A0A1Y2CZ09_9FUNG|nr:ARM repeat-containing protein [Rhizoclosmatium globosum]|eukprot:ORY52094.1 ARM repeat-containing protein [Rhizoclosmatium globosum]
MGKSSKHPSAKSSSNSVNTNNQPDRQSSSSAGSSSSSSANSSGTTLGNSSNASRRSQDEMSEFIDWETELGVSNESIDDDIKGTDEVKVFTRLHKTEEEIQMLSLDEDLDEVKRIMLLIRTGQNVQLPAVLAVLPRLVKDRRKETVTQIIPLLLESLPTRPTDFQIMAASVMYEIIEKGLLPDILVDEIQQCASKLLNSRDEDVSAVWGDVLIVSIKFMSQKAIYDSILPGCHAYSGLSQPVPLRIWSCRMLGAVTSKLKSSEIEALFQKAITLCQDTDYEVRACMCHQLNEFVKYVKLDSIRRSLFHEYVELIMDEEDYVREAALANIVKLAEFIDDSTKSNIIVPIWKKLVTEKPARLLELMARDFGAFLFHTKNVMTEVDIKFFLEFYHFMVFSTEEDLRIWSAYNFPGVLKTVGPDTYESFKLDQALSHLSMDQVIEVKRRIACGFHEVVELLDKQSQYLLRNIFLRLLSDQEVDVYEPLFKNLNTILRGFALDESGRKTAQFDELLFSILRKEREYASNASYKLTWRIHHALLQQFKFFIDYFDSEYIHDQCVPLLFKLLSDNVTVPIKQTIIETLCLYLRKMRRLENRMKIIRNIADLRESANYHTRRLFMWTLKALYSHFSHHFIRETFFDEFLDMARDTVPNIRLTFVSLSALFRKSLLRGYHTIQQQQQQQQHQPNNFGQYLQQSQGGGGGGASGVLSASPKNILPPQQNAVMSNITRLNECLMALCGDQDKDVATAAQDELDRLGIGARRTSKAITLGLDELDDSGGNSIYRVYSMTEFEVMEDREREEYEERLLSIEIEEDSSVMRRRDDDSTIGPGGRNKRISVSKHPSVKAAAAGGIGSSSGHRKSVSSKATPLMPPPKLGTSPSTFTTTPGIMNPRSMGLANRSLTGNHGSLTQLTSTSTGPMAALPPENLKRGKSAGPIGKTKTLGGKASPSSSTIGFNESNYTTTAELGRKKSLNSLTQSKQQTLKAGTTGFVGGQRKDVAPSSSPSTQPRKPIETTNTAGVIGMRSIGGGITSVPAQQATPRSSSGIKALPPIEGTVTPNTRRH